MQAKADAETCGVQPALQYPNVTLMTGAEAQRLLTSDDGRWVTGVVVQANGKSQTFTADRVVVSCGAINSAALLLRSANTYIHNKKQ